MRGLLLLDGYLLLLDKTNDGLSIPCCGKGRSSIRYPATRSSVSVKSRFGSLVIFHLEDGSCMSAIGTPACTGDVGSAGATCD